MKIQHRALRAFASTTLVFGLCSVMAMTQAQSSSDGRDRPTDNASPANADRDEQSRTISPARGIRRDAATDENAVHQPLRRLVPAAYADGASALAGGHRPSARAISNAVLAQSTSILNEKTASDFVWQWGQFIDHDIDLTDGTNPPEPVPINVPTGDPFFDPDATGTQTIAFNRSLHTVDAEGVRQQINEITGWIDASHIYGSDAERENALRALDGSGRLRTSEGNLLPFNTMGLPNAGGDSDTLFIAGDVRANEQVALTIMHTLFVREHNRWVETLRNRQPDASGEELFQGAKRRVTAIVQRITYEEFLPVLLGNRALPRYRGLRRGVDARIANIFSTSAFRIGHSMLSPTLLRLDAQSAPVDNGPLALRAAFFNPGLLQNEGLEPLLRGLAAQICQAVDAQVIDDVRNFLFGAPGQGGFDLASLNIQRGRDHGLPSYNDAREALGLQRASDFAELPTDEATRTRLSSVYASVDDIDVWVGGLAEQPRRGSLLGPLNHQIVRAQFIALRDGDANWWERVLTDREKRDVRDVRLADVIRANTDIGDEIGNNVFIVGQSARQR